MPPKYQPHNQTHSIKKEIARLQHLSNQTTNPMLQMSFKQQLEAANKRLIALQPQKTPAIIAAKPQPGQAQEATIRERIQNLIKIKTENPQKAGDVDILIKNLESEIDEMRKQRAKMLQHQRPDGFDPFIKRRQY